MSLLVDDIVVSPNEAVPDGEEQSLSEAGLSIVGANFGEVLKKGTEVKTATGTVMVNREPQTRTVVLRLRVLEESETTLPEAAARLEQIVGELQSREGWFRRDFHAGGEFGSLLYRICGEVTLGDFAGWQVGDSPDVTVSMVCDYAVYDTIEVESEAFEETKERELIFELPGVGGSVDGLMRLLITNLGKDPWRACTVAMESRDHPQDETANTTAKLAYGCQELTLKGGATKAEREGFKVARHSSLAAGWLSILNSQIVGVGHMTHRGVRRVKFRVYDPGEEPGNVQLRLRWRNLGTLQWSENAIVSTPLVGGWQELDLGEVRLEEAVTGEQHWEWDLQARSVNGTGTIDLQRLRCYPTEYYVVVEAPEILLGPDALSSKAAGTGASVKVIGGGAWSGPGNITSSDGSKASATISLSGLPGGGSNPRTQQLWATGFGFLPPESAEITGVVVEIERSRESELPVEDRTVQLLKGGAAVGSNLAIPGLWPLADAVQAYGGSETTWGAALTGADVLLSNFGVVVEAQAAGTTGGVALIDRIGMILYWSEAKDENRICFAKRSIEFSTDGVRRQHPEEEIWGEIVPKGFALQAPASGPQGRIVRGIIVPSQGDNSIAADSGDNSLSLIVATRSAHLYAGNVS